MASTPNYLPFLMASLLTLQLMSSIKRQPSICDSTEGLGPSLSGRQSYCRWKDPDVHHLHSPQAFITFPSSSEIGLTFTEVGANARSTQEDFSYQQRVEKKMVFTNNWAFKGKLILQNCRHLLHRCPHLSWTAFITNRGE